MINKIVKTIPLYLILLTVALSSCSTKKKSFINRKYHDTTAKYNGYFNGKESLKAGIKRLEKSHVDDYSKIIPVYKEGGVSNSKNHHLSMDNSIKKASKVIQKHSISIRGREYCKWIDDSYFLLAQAYYYKGEYMESKKAFDHIIKSYKKSDLFYPSKIWLAKCYVGLGDYMSAEKTLDKIEAKRNALTKHQKEFNLTYADMLLQQGFTLEAVDRLKLASANIKSSRKKSRYNFIIAQIYQEAGNLEMAKKYYEKVLGSNPEYDMAFNAKINLAKSLRNQEDLSEMKKSLLKMIKDEKNKEYLDQIHFTLGEIHLIERDTSKAVENFNKSYKLSVQNDLQKSQSFLALGKIYFHKNNFKKSQVYYDSAYIFMIDNQEGFSRIKRKRDVLTKLVYNLDIINLQDSLQKLASMSDEERRSIISNIISEIAEKERRDLLEKQNKLRDGMLSRDPRSNNFSLNSGGKWYFYNPTTLSFGLSEFRKIWGKRKLEDDWRRVNKRSVSLNEDSVTVDVKNQDKKKNLRSPEYYLDQIPLSAEKMERSNKKILKSTFEAHLIFKNDLKKIEYANHMLHKIINQFPQNPEYSPISHYLLYQNYVLVDKDKSERLKKRLYETFPENPYTKALYDKNYIQEELKIKEKNRIEYDSVFQKFLNNDYVTSLLLSSSKLKKILPQDDYFSKYVYIKIVSEFKINSDSGVFVSSLKKGIKTVQDTSVILRFSELLENIRNPEGLERRNEIAFLKSVYKYSERSNHYLAIINPKKKTDLNYIKTLVSDYNMTNYSNSDLNINAVMFGVDNHLLLVKGFKNKSQAQKYQENLLIEAGIINELSKTKFTHFIISENNYQDFYINTDLEGYLKFYKNKYN